ncbi:Fungal-trans domain-containing protein [Fusarium keratoplasticum]|nr:Fungal-trans domain-containing protein [Fusarium keratoplasticum]
MRSIAATIRSCCPNDHTLKVNEAVGNRTRRPVDGELWVTLNDEIHKMKKIIEEDHPEALLHEDDAPHSVSEYSSPSCPETPQLDPVTVFKLWQIFLDRVNPLIKIIHAPSVQVLIVSAAADITLIPLDQQALMYSIFGLAVLALRSDELAAIFGEDKTREGVLQDMLKSVSGVLVRFDALKRYNMVVLQALLHTSIVLMGQCNKHASWVMLGSLTEMRRRIWWQIVMYDIKLGIDCGLTYSCIPKSFDTKQPLNLNDADLFPDATGELTHRDGPTEMAFVMMIHRVAAYLLDEETRQAVEANILGQEIHPTSVERNRTLIDGLEADLLDMEKRFIIGKASNAHTAALGIRPHLIKRLHDMMRPMHESPDWGVDVFSPRDNLFKLILSSCENASDSYEQMDRWGFAWYIRLHFNLDLLASLSTFLYHRPLSSLADRGWTIFTSPYIRDTLLQEPKSKAAVISAQFALRAYTQRERTLADAGQCVETPNFIIELRQIINSPLATPPLPAILNQWAALGTMTTAAIQMEATHEMNMHMFMPFTGEGRGDGSYDFWPAVPWRTD